MTWDSRGSSSGNNTSGPWYASDPPTGSLPPYLRQPAHHGRPRKSRRLVIAVTAGALVVVAGIAAGVVTVFTGGSGGNTTGFVPNGSSPQEDAQQVTTAFLQAWQKGDLQQAARYTNHPAIAQASLAEYQKYLHLKRFSGTPQNATAVNSDGTRESVQYSVSARIASGDGPKAISGSWNYHSSLVTYQQPNSQVWYVSWSPDILAPNLTASTHLAAVQVAPQVVMVADSSGKNLNSYGDAGLNNIARDLEQKGPSGQGSPGLYVEIQTASGQLVPNSQAVIIAPNNIASVTTTINPQAEAAARTAVSMHKGSAMVAIQPSTGKILAIANNAQDNDFALTAGVAPGSTMKTITSTALFNKGIVTANTGVSCPLTYTVQGITYHNDQGESEPPSTPLYEDYAQSCNNAFDKWWPQLSNGGLANTAKDYYGLDQEWDIGLGESASYMNVPAQASGSELAQELFGEGQLKASPLAMASVAATVESGQFQQPYVVSGTTRATAKALPSSTDSQLKQMMRAVVTQGTAAGLGFGPNVYAKTGTADIIGQEQPNSWLIAFDPTQDVAVAFLVVNAGYGAQFAGPEAAAFLNSF